MYLDRIIIENYGAIKKMDYKMPFNNDGTPKPVVLVGKNGSGKTLLLSNIVNSLIESKRNYYHELPEVSDNNYYRVGSMDYITNGTTYSYERYEFNTGITYSSLMTQSYEDLLSMGKGFDGIDLCDGRLKTTGFYSHSDKIDENVFENNIFLYLPVERYYVPTWINKENSKIIYANQDKEYLGKSRYGIVKYNLLQEIESWIIDVIVDKTLYEEKNLIIDNDGCKEVGKTSIGKNTSLHEMLNDVLTRIYRNKGHKRARIGVTRKQRLYRQLTVVGMDEKGQEKEIVRGFANMSSGEAMVFGMMATILREFDKISSNQEINFANVKGIVMIDEIDLHLHSDLIKEVLPGLIRIFPNVQFIVSSHSPFFLLGMKDVFEERCQFLGMPNSINISQLECEEEFRKCYSIVDQNYQSILDALKMVDEYSIKRPLVITEGKTDWKHLKAAIRWYQKHGEYVDLKLDFLEDGVINGDGDLESLLNQLARVHNDHVIIGVFDNDSAVGIKYQEIKDFGNNVVGCCISDTQGYDCGISIELLYDRDTLKKRDEEGRRIFLSDEFSERSHRLLSDKTIVCQNKTITDAIRRKIIKVVDKNVFDENENNIAMTKEDFATKVLREEPPYNDISFEGFRNIIEILQEIIKKENSKVD